MALLFEQIPIAAGFALAWSLAAPPGPANALIAHVAAQRSFGAGWVTGLGAVCGDLVMFVLMWVGVLRVVEAFPATKLVFAAAGAALMLFFAYEAWRTARHARGTTDPAEAAPDVTAAGGFARSFVTVTTSPFNWGWWIGVGSSLFAALGWGIVLGFFAGLVAWTAFWSGLAREGATRIPRFRESVALVSAVALVFFAGVVALFAVQTALELWG